MNRNFLCFLIAHHGLTKLHTITFYKIYLPTGILQTKRLTIPIGLTIGHLYFSTYIYKILYLVLDLDMYLKLPNPFLYLGASVTALMSPPRNYMLN